MCTALGANRLALGLSVKINAPLSVDASSQMWLRDCPCCGSHVVSRMARNFRPQNSDEASADFPQALNKYLLLVNIINSIE